MSIQVRQLDKYFGQYHTLKSIDLDFPEGELVALLGPSGCGKTTLLRIIAGLEGADHGQVILAGRDATDDDVRQRQVGFVFQHYALFRHMTIFENVAFGLRVRPRATRPSESEIKRRVMDLLALVQLEFLADRYPPQLSGGQRQRIALARALAVEPRVLLLDEPFGALDAKVRKDLRRWLRNLHDELHISSIFVTHDQEEALEVADQIVIMNQGQIEQIGSPREVYEQPATPFVFDFLGQSNRFEGQLSEGRLILPQQQHLRVPDAPAAFERQSVIGFARPHELTLSTVPLPNTLPAHVVREHWLAGDIRVEVQTTDGQLLDIALTAAQMQELSVKPQQPVWVGTSRLHLFAGSAA